jgi:putative redox protein
MSNETSPTVQVLRDRTAGMRHIVHVRDHILPTDIAVADGGGDTGPDPHDLYDSALGACKALTVLWYARKKGIPVEDIQLHITRDGSAERAGTYRLAAELRVTGDLTDAQRRELLSVADKCPVHKLMTQVTTEITTTLADPAAAPSAT